MAPALRARKGSTLESNSERPAFIDQTNKPVLKTSGQTNAIVKKGIKISRTKLSDEKKHTGKGSDENGVAFKVVQKGKGKAKEKENQIKADSMEVNENGVTLNIVQKGKGKTKQEKENQNKSDTMEIKAKELRKCVVNRKISKENISKSDQRNRRRENLGSNKEGNILKAQENIDGPKINSKKLMEKNNILKKADNTEKDANVFKSPEEIKMNHKKTVNRKKDHNETLDFFQNVQFHSTLNESNIARIELELTASKNTTKSSSSEPLETIEEDPSSSIEKGKKRSAGKSIFKEPPLKQRNIMEFMVEKSKISTKPAPVKSNYTRKNILPKTKSSQPTNDLLKDCFGFDNCDEQTPPRQLLTDKWARPWRVSFADLLVYIKKNEIAKQKWLSFIHNKTLMEKTQNMTKAEEKEKKTVSIQEEPTVIVPKKKTKKQEKPVDKKVHLVQKKITEMKVADKVNLKTRNANKTTKSNNYFQQSNTTELFPEETDAPVRDKPARRSYVKKIKEREIIDEPSTEDVYKELNKKQKKVKKSKKEEADMEEWSKSINSAFDEVEKFELHVD